jgi:voltage-gated potassium channel Kch
MPNSTTPTSAETPTVALSSEGGREGYIVIGETPAAGRVCATLDGTAQVRHMASPDDAELESALRDGVRSAAILVRDDVAALRYALALAHLDESLPLVVTIFDRTIADQLRKFLPQVSVCSPATLAAPSLIGPCLEPDLLASYLDSDELVEVRSHGNDLSQHRTAPPRRSRRARLTATLRWDHRHHDAGTRMLLIGLLGLAAILVGDWCWLVLAKEHSVGESFLEASRVVATVGPGPTETGAAYDVASGLAMLATIVFTAMFTAGLIDRLFEPRLLGLLGPKAAPHGHHVIVVGMGQLGVRLCAQLMALNIPVVGVERHRTAPFLPLARQLGIPVFIGDGTERRVLEKLKLRRSRALAAVGSDDLDNISVVVAAAAVSPSTRVVLRAGEQEAIAETRSLLPLGVIRDVTELTATFVVARLLGKDVDGVVAGSTGVYIQTRAGTYEEFPVSRWADCRHAGRSTRWEAATAG